MRVAVLVCLSSLLPIVLSTIEVTAPAGFVDYERQHVQKCGFIKSFENRVLNYPGELVSQVEEDREMLFLRRRQDEAGGIVGRGARQFWLFRPSLDLLFIQV